MIPLRNSILAISLVLTTAGTSYAGSVRVTAGDDSRIFQTNAGGAGGTGLVCVNVIVDAVTLKPGMGEGLCSVVVPTDDFLGSLRITYESLPGVGRSTPKFVLAPDGLLRGNSDLIQKLLTATAPDGSFVTSSALAKWDSSITYFMAPPAPRIVETNAKHEIAAAVARAGRTKIFGQAASESKDPLFLDFDTAGDFKYNYEIDNLSLFSDELDGYGAVGFRTGFSNVTFLDRQLNGDLFRLAIGAKGIINSPANLTIVFDPWIGLGLSQSQIISVQESIRSQLTTLDGGIVGLAPGNVIRLFGDGGILPTLTLSHGTGTVEYTDNVSGVAVLPVPEPTSTLSLLALGTLGAASTLKRKLKPSQSTEKETTKVG